MKLLLRRKGLLAVVIAVIIVLAMTIASFITGGATPIANAFGVVMRPVQTFINGLTGGIESYYNYMYEYDTLLAENAQLRLRVAELEAASRQYTEDREENVRLKELLKVSEKRPELSFAPANIITRDSSNWSRVFTVDGGASSGIAVGDCVLSSEGYFVGIVSEVGHNWSAITTIVDTDVEVAARVFRTGLIGVAQGDFLLMQEGRLALSYLPADSDILNGDEVLTTGVGGVYPKDVPIGKIIDVRLEDSGISVRAVIEPLADLARLTQVFVVVNYTEG